LPQPLYSLLLRLWLGIDTATLAIATTTLVVISTTAILIMAGTATIRTTTGTTTIINLFGHNHPEFTFGSAFDN